MDIRITTLPTRSLQPSTALANSPMRFSSLNKPLNISTDMTLSSNASTKKTHAKSVNNFLLLPENMTATNPVDILDKRGVLLYQQVERNKVFSNGSELVNRFHYEV